MSTPGSDPTQTPSPAPDAPAVTPDAPAAPPAAAEPSAMDRAVARIEANMAARGQQPPQEPVQDPEAQLPGQEPAPGTPGPQDQPPAPVQDQPPGEPRDPLVSDLIARLNGADEEIRRLRQSQGMAPDALQQGSIEDRLQRVGLTFDEVVDDFIGATPSSVPGMPGPGDAPAASPAEGDVSPQFLQYMQQTQTLIQQLTDKVTALEGGQEQVTQQLSTRDKLAQVSGILQANPARWPRIAKAIESGNYQPLNHALETQRELQKKRESGDYMTPTSYDVALDGVEGVLRQQVEYYRSLEPQGQGQQQPPQQQQQSPPQQQPPQAAGGNGAPTEPTTLGAGGGAGGTPTPRKLTREERLRRAEATIREKQRARAAAKGGQQT